MTNRETQTYKLSDVAFAELPPSVTVAYRGPDGEMQIDVTPYEELPESGAAA